MIKLNVPILGQRDSRWANQRLGTVNGTTIGGYGCIITCMSMLASYYNHAITPDVMDNWLTDNQGYEQGNLYRNDAFSREFPDCKFDSVVFCTDIPAPLGQIDTYLSAGKPVVVMVDFDHDPNDGIQTHFVLIVGREDNGDYVINDPWFGDQVYFKARYGDQAKGINQINFFSGPVPQTPSQPDLQKQLDDTRKQRDDNWNLYQEEIKKTTANQDKINDLNTQLNTKNVQLDDISKQLTACQNKPLPEPTPLPPPDVLSKNVLDILNAKWSWFGVSSWQKNLAKLKALFS